MLIASSNWSEFSNAASSLMEADGKKKLTGGLRALAERQYDPDGLRSKDRLLQLWDHIEKFFGAEARAVDITSLRMDDYVTARLA